MLEPIERIYTDFKNERGFSGYAILIEEVNDAKKKVRKVKDIDEPLFNFEIELDMENNIYKSTSLLFTPDYNPLYYRSLIELLYAYSNDTEIINLVRLFDRFKNRFTMNYYERINELLDDLRERCNLHFSKLSINGFIDFDILLSQETDEEYSYVRTLLSKYSNDDLIYFFNKEVNNNFEMYFISERWKVKFFPQKYLKQGILYSSNFITYRKIRKLKYVDYE